MDIWNSLVYLKGWLLLFLEMNKESFFWNFNVTEKENDHNLLSFYEHVMNNAVIEKTTDMAVRQTVESFGQLLQTQ